MQGQREVNLSDLLEARLELSRDQELRCAPEQFDHFRTQLAPQLGSASSVPRRRHQSRHRNPDPNHAEAYREDQPSRREQRPGNGNRRRRHRQRDQRRDDSPHHQLLQGLDVAHDARQQVAAMVRAQPPRGQRFEALEEPDPQLPEKAQRAVVGGQPLNVAKDTPSQPKGAHGHDGDHQLEDGRVQRRSGQEEARRHQQGGRAGGRTGAGRHGPGQRPPARPDQPENTDERRAGGNGHATDLMNGRTTRPLSRQTMRSAA